MTPKKLIRVSLNKAIFRATAVSNNTGYAAAVMLAINPLQGFSVLKNPTMVECTSPRCVFVSYSTASLRSASLRSA